MLRPASRAQLARYGAGVAITVFAILSQYFVPEAVPALRPVYGTLVGDLAVVYGVPVLAFLLLVGAGPLRHWADRMPLATLEGLRWYGLLSLLALVIVLALAVVYTAVDPSALKLLDRPNPALQQAVGNPWLYVALSFVVGAFEETIFRGWIFGFWRDQPGSWIVPAIWTSVVFAGVHLYYATTYGPAAPLIFPSLFLLGFAFAAAYRASGGNLVVVALLHGANDATAFLTLVNANLGDVLHYAVILVGALVGLVLYLRPSAASVPPPGASA
ncbi:MAG: CPBP family intramembrane metalloprotease [Thermoplasmata archaeon]|jgi:membrane protease YdiL (CAAX protease family)|nr:CPBP family intramembrane metalloprotease [Thermoplasmata archaeon]